MPDLQYRLIVFVVYLWSVIWKGIALYRAAKSNQKVWFICMLVLSTAGILEIVYLFGFAKNKLTLDEMKSWLPSSMKKK